MSLRSVSTVPLLLAALLAVACDTSVPANENTNSKSAAESPIPDEPFTPAGAADFAGSWEVISDDGTQHETADIEVVNGGVAGTLRSLEHGYFSGKTTVTAEASIRGAPSAGGLDITAWDAQTGSEQNAITGRAVRRGEFMIMRVGVNETGYARPGVSVVQSAEGSDAAASFARAVAGHIYSTSSESSGRGAFVGSRVKLALCSDGSVAFDVSDLASAPVEGGEGVDMGSSVSRRGQWGVVLLAGVPVVRANWSGTGTSYSLTRYFRVRPAADASSASIDGTELPVTGSC